MRLSALALALTLLSFNAHAQNWYVQINGMGTILQDADNTDVDGTVESEHDFGGGGGAAVGYSFGPVRIEGEVAYRSNDVDDLIALGTSAESLGLAVDGSVDSFAVLANVWYDISQIGGPVVPYVGGGVGFAVVTLDDVSAGGVLLADDDDTVFAYQVGVGVHWNINPRFALDVGYRLMGTSDPDFKAADGSSFDSEYLTHNFLVGFKINL